MPKEKTSVRQKLRQLVQEFGADVFSTDDSVLFCKCCEKSVNFEKKYFVSQHVRTAKHHAAAARRMGSSKSTSLLPIYAAVSNRQSQFFLDLCKSLIDAGIPLWKIENASLKSFLEKYTKEQIPSESTLRKGYIDLAYNETMEKIRQKVAAEKIWVCIDETSDAVGRYVVNVIIGTICASSTPKVFLLTSEEVERANSTTIAQVFTNSMDLLWPDGVKKHDNILLFLTDAAPYMKKAAESLKILFPAMMHVTCVVHALHRIAEEVRAIFPDVDQLVSNFKKVYVKSPLRVQRFKEIAPELTLPPQPVLTRWGTWISASLYYAQNFEKLKKIVNALDENEASSIRIVQQLMQKNSIQQDLSFIAANFSNLPAAITELEKRNEPLVHSVKILENTVSELLSIPGEKGESVRKKCERVFSCNSDLGKMKTIANILAGSPEKVDSVNYPPGVIACFKYAPITSVEVERSFSMFKLLFTDRRRNLTFENLKKHLVIMCNQHSTSQE